MFGAYEVKTLVACASLITKQTISSSVGLRTTGVYIHFLVMWRELYFYRLKTGTLGS
jgi:hypothetical protein